MEGITLFSPNDYRLLSWKNGQGTTTELYRKVLSNEQGNDQDFAWRLSMADVVVDGVFSHFLGYDRTLILIEGNGLELQHESGKTNRLEQLLDLCHFSGNDATNSKLIDGPIKDFNIISHSDICKTKVSIIKDRVKKEFCTKTKHVFIYSLFDTGMVLCQNENVITIPKDHLLHIPKNQLGQFSLRGACLICVQIEYKA